MRQPTNLLAGMDYVSMNVVLLPPELVEKARATFRRSGIGSAFCKQTAKYMRAYFNRHGVYPANCLPRDLKKYEPHHIIPLCLNGANDSSNMAIVEPKLHTAIHQHINDEIDGMKYGESRTIFLPRIEASIWVLQPEPQKCQKYAHAEPSLLLQNAL